MKKILLLSTLFSFVAAVVFAQSISLSHEGTVLEPNEEITLTGPATYDEMIIELDVTNNSASALDVLVKKVENYLISGSSNVFCWANQCYGPNVYISPNFVNIGAGATVSDDFSGHYNPNTNPGESSISYVFYDANNVNDSIMVTLIYTTETNGYADNLLNKFNISEPYPNPASSYVKFDYDLTNVGNSTLNIYSLVGSLVREISFTDNSGTLQVNTGGLEEGFYFYRLSNGASELKTGKFIVKH